MRNSKAKAIRRLVKERGNDPQQTAYTKTNEINKPVFSTWLDGKRKVVSTYITHTSILEANCGRAQYKRFKSFFK